MEVGLRAVAQGSLDALLFENALLHAEHLFAEFRTLENLAFYARCFIAAGDHASAVHLLNSFYPFSDHQMPATSAAPVGMFSSSAASSSVSAFRGRGGPKASAASPLGQCLYVYAVACARTKRWHECYQALEHLDLGTCSHARYWRGVAALNMHDMDNARANLAQCVAADPTNVAAYEAAVRLDPASVARPDSTLVGHPSTTADDGHTAAAPPVSAAPARRGPAGNAGRPAGSSVRRSGSLPSATSAAIGGGASHAQPPAGAAAGSSGSATPPTPSATAPGTYSSSSSQQQPLPLPQSTSAALQRHMAPFQDATWQLWSFRCSHVASTLAAAIQRRHGWALELAGLASFHSGEMAQAVKHFQAMLEVEPWRLNREAVVLYSTALWHVKREAALGGLAQRMIENHPQSAYTMCVVGNCYSLVKNAQSAHAMFERATQLAPNFAYARTLQGHEALALDMKDEAEAQFRKALLCEPRHYNAFVGLGDCAARTEELQAARNHLRQAVAINELPLIINRLAATFHSQNYASETDLRTALHLYDRAIEAKPTNYAAVHQRATVLLRMNHVDDALAALEWLLGEVPEEAALHMTTGHCLARLGRSTQAVAAYRRAADLDPRRAHMAKACIDRLGAGDGQN